MFCLNLARKLRPIWFMLVGAGAIVVEDTSVNVNTTVLICPINNRIIIYREFTVSISIIGLSCRRRNKREGNAEEAAAMVG